MNLYPQSLIDDMLAKGHQIIFTDGGMGFMADKDGNIMGGDPVTGAIVGGSVISGATSMFGSKAEEDAYNKGIAAQEQQYQQSRNDIAPWMTAGQENINALNAKMNSGYFDAPYQFQEDPGYQFRLSEGEKGINRMAAARGDFFSGRGAKELNRYNQDYASNEYGKGYARYRGELNDTYNHMMGISDAGQRATQYIGNLGAGTANAMQQGYQGAGKARSGGYTGVGNAMTQGLTNYGTYKGW